MNNTAFFVLLLLPGVLLALASLYFLLRARSMAAWLVAAGSVLSLLLGIAQNAIPKRSFDVFDAEGNAAGVMFDSGDLGFGLAWAGVVPDLLIAGGLVLLARNSRRSSE